VSRVDPESSKHRADASWDVLVIDDESVVCSGIRKVLEGDGLRVATVERAADALGHRAVSTCRLVLCDLLLPDGSGTDLIQAFHRRRPGLPVLLITGYATPDQERQALAAGAAAFLAKPFDEAELLEIVRKALARGGVDEQERQS
jgi:DNA-binding NtrC family response regulator